MLFLFKSDPDNYDISYDEQITSISMIYILFIKSSLKLDLTNLF